MRPIIVGNIHCRSHLVGILACGGIKSATDISGEATDEAKATGGVKPELVADREKDSRCVHCRFRRSVVVEKMGKD